MKYDIFSSKPYFPEESIRKILQDTEKILRGYRLTQGDFVRQFENSFAQTIGVKHAIATTSGTSSLEIILRYFNVLGKEVIVPTNTFIASSNSVILAGGKPVFCDIDPETLCMDPEDLRTKIGPNTKAVMMVHFGGFIPPYMGEIVKIANQNKLILIEDAAHAHGAQFEGKKAGAIGDAGSFSFYQSKVITSCEGGMITTDDDSLAEFAHSLLNHGAGPIDDAMLRKGYNDNFTRIGNNWRMHEITAVVGLSQLEILDDILRMKHNIAQKYIENLSDLGEIKLLQTKDIGYKKIVHSYYRFSAMLDRSIDRYVFAEDMKRKFGIRIVWSYYPPCHLKPVYRDLYGYWEGMCPQAEEILKHNIFLPIYPQLTDAEVAYIIKVFSSELC